MNGYCFTSSLFQIERGEDEEINPGLYGRQLAVWLGKQLEKRGYSVEPIINEDWGRCLMCSRDPFMLWVGCGNAVDPELFWQEPHKGIVVWHCFVVAEVPIWKRLLHPFRRILGCSNDTLGIGLVAVRRGRVDSFVLASGL